MELKQFTALLDTMTLAAEAADGERFASCFTRTRPTTITSTARTAAPPTSRTC